MKIKVRSILQQALDDLNTLASAEKDEEIYIDQTEAKAQALLEYITDLQRKEYNNSKAIEYIKEHIKYECDDSINGMSFYSYHLYDFKKEDLLNILEKGE